MTLTLVTGATGLVGYSIVQALVRRGRRVRALVRSIEKARALLPPACELVQGDLADLSAVRRAVHGCSVVYHAAALSERWQASPVRFRDVNVGGTRNALDAARTLGVLRFVYTSTIDVFASQAGREFDESDLDPKPRGTHYERSRQLADEEVADAHQRGLPAIFLHPSSVYGPGPVSLMGLNHFFALLRRGRLPALPPGGLPIVFGPDVGEGHVVAEERALIGSRYILSESYYTLKELARTLLEEIGLDKRPPPTLPFATAHRIATVGEWLARLTRRPPPGPKAVLSLLQAQARPRSDKAQRDLGWQPTPLREGLRKTLAFLSGPPR